MEITITGPRSVGKSTISKVLAKKLKLAYISSDEIGEKALKKEGGLDKAIKSGVIHNFIEKGAYNLIREVYQSKNFVFDLAGGAVSSTKHPEASEKVRTVAKSNSVVIGLLPCEDEEESIEFLFEREKNRAHFKDNDKIQLREDVERKYRKLKDILRDIADKILYVKNKEVNEVVEEIISEVKE